MFPRNLVARSGRSGESIVLLDERGCPTDESIVERFRPADGSGGRMVTPFEVFKFYDDPVVRFQVTVQFCLERCRPVSERLMAYAADSIAILQLSSRLL